MADWEEIKRLAADFQRTQTSHILQKISERNCIDIIKKLTDLKLIELIYTCDGKEFLTPEHLQKEIEDEVHVNGGRVHLHDLAASLNVDYQHVDKISRQIVAEKPGDYNLILGQIIHSTYKATLEKQIHDMMICTGQLSIADFAKSIDLPSEFLATLVKELIPKVIGDYVTSADERTYYTSDMMERYKSVIVGTLVAISRPTNIASIMKKLDISERLFLPIVEDLIKEGRVDASIDNRTFIPSIYAKEQNDWVDSFYSSNQCIAYDVLMRKDVKQPKAFLKKRYPDGMQLKSCFISPGIISQVEALLEDCISTNSLIDVSSMLPSSIQSEDIEQLLGDIFKKKKQLGNSCMVINQTNICSLSYIATCKESLSKLMEMRAREQLKEGKLMNHFHGTIRPNLSKQQQQQERLKQEAPDEPTIEDKMIKEGTGNEAKSDDKTTKKVDTADGDNNQAHKQQHDVTKGKQNEDIELTAEDLKREKRQKKGKGAERTAAAAESDDELDNAGGKKSKSRKSGGGVQGREIKQKATKKKYMAGAKGKQGNNDSSDSDAMPTSTGKQPRSKKGRAARRGVSPEPREASVKVAVDQGKGKQAQIEKKPLIFLEYDQLVSKLRDQTREAGEFNQALFESIASMLETDLNQKYEMVARKVLDDYLKEEADKDGQTGNDGEIDLVE